MRFSRASATERSATAILYSRSSFLAAPCYGFLLGEGDGVIRDVGGTRVNGGVARVTGGRDGVTRGVGFGPWPQFAAASRCEE
jgi:hypothetical protein